MKRLFIVLGILYTSIITLKAQQSTRCTHRFQGVVLYESTQLPIVGATVFIEELDTYTLTSREGEFLFEKICEGTYTIHIHMVSCIHKDTLLKIPSSDKYILALQAGENLDAVVIQGYKASTLSSLNTQAILTGQELERTRGTTLGEALKVIPGVSALQTGPSIFKPVIHGMHSNRVLILNNGIRQEGQQWGAEHAPEIDPFIANQLSVIKGPASIRYGSDAIAGVVLVNPAAMPSIQGIAGEINVVGASNNRMGATSGILQGTLGKKHADLSWRLQGTYRRAGNTKTPGYYLENTGFKELNYSGTLAYTKSQYGGELFYSLFNTRLGIFSGAHAETLPDIIAAINRPEPITPSYFSYHINRPYQEVRHGLFKASAYLRFNPTNRLDITFARQQNIRSEYDYIPLSGQTTPELYLDLTSHSLDVVYKHEIAARLQGSIGFNGITQGNVRMYQMLIPNFRNYSGGVFVIEKWSRRKWTFEGGLRYDYRWMTAYMLDNTTAQVVKPTFNWQNATGSMGARYPISPRLFGLINASNAWRAPTANELLSNGVHQSAIAYENGNPKLHTERSYHISAELNYQGKKLNGSLEVYNHYMNGYIFLKPDLSYVHTVRGAYPSYTYTQVNALFRGLDLSANYRVVDSLYFITKTSLLYAYNYTIHDDLQLVPSNRFENTLKYVLGNRWDMKDAYFSLTCLYTAKQRRVPSNSDYAPPPAGYVLVNADIGLTLPLGSQKINLSMSIVNIFDVRYRDYLDRFRYFTDALGRNITLRIKIPFEFIKQIKQ